MILRGTKITIQWMIHRASGSLLNHIARRHASRATTRTRATHMGAATCERVRVSHGVSLSRQRSEMVRLKLRLSERSQVLLQCKSSDSFEWLSHIARLDRKREECARISRVLKRSRRMVRLKLCFPPERINFYCRTCRTIRSKASNKPRY